MTRSLPRPVACLVMAALLLVAPVGFYLAVRLGAQPTIDFLAHQFGGTAGTLLPRPLVNWMALVAAGAGVVFDLDGLMP